MSVSQMSPFFPVFPNQPVVPGEWMGTKFMHTKSFPVASGFRPGIVAADTSNRFALAATQTIPEWPAFANLDRGMSTAIHTHVASFAPYADWTLTTMRLWHEAVSVSMLFGNLVARLVDSVATPPYFTFLGANHPADTITVLLAAARGAGCVSVVHRVPAVFEADSDVRGRCWLEDEVGTHEYVYLNRELCSLAGGANRWKRHHLSAFRKSHDPTFVGMDLSCEDTQHAMLNLAETWVDQAEAAIESDGGVERPAPQLSLTALKRLFRWRDELPVQGLGLVVDRRLVAFVVYELVRHHTAVVHFHTADKRFAGAAQVILCELARVACGHGIPLTNLQEDLGLPGLRLAKTLLRPSTVLGKFRIAETCAVRDVRSMSTAPLPERKIRGVAGMNGGSNAGR